MISFETVKNEFYECINSSSAKIPIEKWKLFPKELKLHNQHRCYGIATSNGEILIYKGFIGSTAYTKLRQTMLHELAHLCAGLENGHNTRFKRVEKRFIGDLDHEKIREDEEILKSGIPYKFRLIAHTEDNKIKDLGGAIRRSKRWMTYKPSARSYDIYQGVKVLNYEYIPYGEIYK